MSLTLTYDVGDGNTFDYDVYPTMDEYIRFCIPYCVTSDEYKQMDREEKELLKRTIKSMLEMSGTDYITEMYEEDFREFMKQERLDEAMESLN